MTPILRSPSGHKALDTLLEGGFPIGRFTLIEGPDEAVLRTLLKQTEAIVQPYRPQIGGKQYAITAMTLDRAFVVTVIVDAAYETMPKALKFYPSLRLQVREGQIKVIKNSTSANQGQFVLLDWNKVEEESQRVLAERVEHEQFLRDPKN